MLSAQFIIFLVVFILRNLIEALSQHKEVHPPSPQEKGTLSLLILTLSFVISGGAVGYLLATGAPTPLWAYTLGIVLFCLGYAGRRIALRTIGENYSTYIRLREEHRLVTSGAYGTVRHPLYAFYLLEMAALVLIDYSALSALCFIAVLLATLPRVRAEEALLSEAFGADFDSYKARSSRLIPFIY